MLTDPGMSNHRNIIEASTERLVLSLLKPLVHAILV